MKKHIICLGDSNTHGYCADANDCADSSMARFNEDERWTCLLQKELGSDYVVYEEGLSGRTTVFKDPCYEGLDALSYLYPCLKSHERVSLLIIMLGTNDVKHRFSTNAYAVALGMRRLVQKAKTVDCWGENKPNILIIAPPPIGKGMVNAPSTVIGDMGLDAIEKSEQLAPLYEEVAKGENVHFLNAVDAGAIFNNIDCMHLTKEGHKNFAHYLSKLIPDIVNND